MKGIEINWSSLKDTKPHEYAVRFLFGGLATVVAGLIARRYGPCIGGLFLSFPAIFPASATLIESHEKNRKAAIGSDGRFAGSYGRKSGFVRCLIGLCWSRCVCLSAVAVA
jgi:Protein of unknown function (DUF3147)